MTLLLDLFCKAGGAGEGYRRAGFTVLGVDIEPQPRYRAGWFVQADALEFVAKYGHMFDAIHASPPCQRYSQLTPTQYKDSHPDLIDPTRQALKATGKPYIIENVAGARRELKSPLMLCGTMFGLNIWRHRYFELGGFDIFFTPPCCHGKEPVLVSGTFRRKGQKRREYSVAECKEAIGIDWMTRTELDEAIPPVFTTFIGRQLMTSLQTEKVA